MGAVKRFGARLGTEHIGGTWMLIACAEFVLAFATASTLFQFGSANDGWSWGASVAGGIVCPALGVLLIAGDPGRYRTFGYPVRAWLVDHTVLGVILLLVFFADPVFSLLRGETHGAPAGIVVVPVLTVAAVVAAVLVHHRHLLTGRTRRENTRQAWYDRVFLARSGPLLWRVVYQPVGLVALVAAVVVIVLLSLGLELLLQVRWQGLSQAGGAVLELVIVGLTTLMSLSYARHRVMTGQPDWFGTRIIRSAQRKALA
jgi:hypothetical protein